MKNICQAVSAAPHSSLKRTFDMAVINPLKPNEQTPWLEQIINVYKCALDVMGNVIGDSDLKPDYDKLKTKVDHIFNHDLVKCREIDDGEDMNLYVYYYHY